jgi:hypothetical protein
MTELLREGIAQADREEFIEEEEMDAHIERMPMRIGGRHRRRGLARHIAIYL